MSVTGRLFTGALTVATAQTVVMSALPVLGAELGVAPPAATWTLTVFMLAGAVATPIAGRLGDMLGYRRVMLGCLAAFTAGTVLCLLGAGTGSYPLLLAGRALSGLGSGVFPLTFGIARAALPPARQPRAIALLSALTGIGGALGMVLSGPLAGAWGTGGLFWPLLPLALLSLLLAAGLPRTGTPAGGRVDLLGALLLAGALVAGLLLISQGRSWGWTAPVTCAVAVAAVLLTVAFLLVERRVPAPLLDIALHTRRAVALTHLSAVLIGCAMFGAITLLPMLAQTPAGYGLDLSPSGTGLLMIPTVVTMLLVSPLAPRLRGRFGSRAPLAAGAAVAAVALTQLALAHDRVWHLAVAGLLTGVAYGLAFAALGSLVVEAVAPAETGAAGGVNTIARTAGGAIGAQLATALVVAGGGERGYVLAFAVFAVLAASAVPLVRALPVSGGGYRGGHESNRGAGAPGGAADRL
ncbi:MFS transporter [Streptomyces carpaticus]|uniref:MFS transporter n=1 Tax=Streptomyces carpaticus TaxID=285558 RepID=UPI00220787A6|nr:MFS transporter [Streptomyces carpaticus]